MGAGRRPHAEHPDQRDHDPVLESDRRVEEKVQHDEGEDAETIGLKAEEARGGDRRADRHVDPCAKELVDA